MDYKTEFNIIEDIVNDMLFDLESDLEESTFSFKPVKLQKEFDTLSDKISTLKAIFIYMNEHPEKNPYDALNDFSCMFYNYSKRGDKAYYFEVGSKVLCEVLDIANSAIK